MNINRELVNVLSAICDSVATPVSALVREHARNGEWTHLQKVRLDPQSYDSPEAYWKDNLVAEFLRKQDIPTDVDKEEVAVQTFLDCERLCARTNAKLHHFLNEHLLLEDARENDVYRFITEWRKNVKFVLGSLPDSLTPRFSGGATYDDIGKLINLPDKMSSVPTIYGTARCLLPLWEQTAWFRHAMHDVYRQDPKTVLGNIFFTVPKDAEKRRGCGKEASIAVCYQLAVGKIMKTKLLANMGIDLLKAQDLHRELAKSSSVDGRLSTIDMSNASDTVSYNLVKLLLPTEWFTLLDSLRASKTRVKGKWFNLEKFSSMGNGFTFELETLIFATLARTLTALEGGDASQVRCFGDDLIVPTENTKGVLAALKYFGFEVNKRKTFVEGPFRESCGGDFFSGVPVRAHYVKELLDEPHQIISVMNGLKKACVIEGAIASCRWIHVVKAWHMLLKLLPKDIGRCRGPDHLGDLVIWDDQTDKWQQRRLPLKDGGTAYGSPIQVRCWRPITVRLKWHHWRPDVQLACCTLGVESEGITPRESNDSPKSFKLAWVIADRNNTWLPETPRGRGNYNTLFV